LSRRPAAASITVFDTLCVPYTMALLKLRATNTNRRYLQVCNITA
jgi:hypothetical protein